MSDQRIGKKVRYTCATVCTVLGIVLTGSMTLQQVYASDRTGADDDHSDVKIIELEDADVQGTSFASANEVTDVGSGGLLSIAELQEKFPDGKYWNHIGSDENNPDGWTDTPCTHHLHNEDDACDYYGGCGCNSSCNAIQCMGFAAKLGLDATGTSFRTWPTTTDIDEVKKGDIIRYLNNGHSIYVTDVEGDQITFADCNWDHQCGIRWNETIGKDDISPTLTKIYRSPSWQQDDNGNWSYFSVDEGTYACNEWMKINGIWYYFNEDSIMATGWVKVDGTWYYLNDNGSMFGGWLKYHNNWFYMAANGKMQTGWINVRGTWYYMNSNGEMQTGWINDKGIWYYCNEDGAMQTGWVKVNGTWYYLASNGKMQSGWLKLKGVWYHCNSSGAMQTGWNKIHDKWYYMNNDGKMQTGWIQYKGSWYYLNKEDGQMMQNCVIDGYKIGADGIWKK